MTLNVNQHFVDREPERERFAQILSGASKKRVLRVLVPPGHGKSWFVTRLYYDCKERQVPVVWLDFDARRSNRPVDVRYVVERFLDRLGEQQLPTTATRVAEWLRSASPAADAQHRAWVGRALRQDLSRWTRSRHTVIDEFTRYEAGISALLVRLGRAHRRYLEAVNYQTRLIYENIAVVRRHGDTPELKADRSRVLTEINRLTLAEWDILFDALCDVPAAETTQLPAIAILLDTFEQMPDSVREWLSGWLFDSLRHDLVHIRLVVAGRPEPECHAFFDQAGLWGHLVDCIDAFLPMPDEDILNYYERRDCTFGAYDPKTVCGIARTSAGMMAQVGDTLPQAGGD